MCIIIPGNLRGRGVYSLNASGGILVNRHHFGSKKMIRSREVDPLNIMSDCRLVNSHHFDSKKRSKWCWFSQSVHEFSDELGRLKSVDWIALLLSNATVGLHSLALEFWDTAHQRPDACNREAPTTKSLTKTKCKPTVTLLRSREALLLFPSVADW